jgi:DUF1365 family protein
MRGSAIYTGRMRHRRHAPKVHEFEYGLNMLYLDLAELDQVFADRWFWSTRGPAPVRFDRADHLGDATGDRAAPLDSCVRDLVERETGHRPLGAIRLLTHPRYFGYGFNPVSFFYCFDTDEQLQTVVAEVNNTPWGESTPYVLPIADSERVGASSTFDLTKRMHVSPFHPMEQRYRWSFRDPGDVLAVHMRNFDADAAADAAPIFDATLVLERRPLTGPVLARALLGHPFMTAEVILGIHWQALKLWLKGVPVHTHPDKRTEDAAGVTAAE